MAWTCQTCSIEVSEDDLACPQCSAPKSSWTIVQNVTRTFRMSGRRVTYLRGEEEATRAPLLRKDRAASLAREGKAPPERDVLVVRLHPGGHADWTVTCTVEFETAEADDRALEVERPADFAKDAHHDVRLVFVHGAGDAAGLTLPGVDHVVDVSEGDGGAGHAPSVELTALGKPRKRLPLGASSAYLINARFFDRTGRVPVRDARCTIAGRACRTDAQGHVRLDDVGPGRHEAEFEAGKVDVPASHHPDFVLRVRLPFHDATEEDLDRHPRRARDHEELPEAPPPPAWLPVDPEDAPLPPEPEEEHEDDETYEETHGDLDDETDDEADDLAIRARILDRSGRVPVRDAACEVAGRTLRTDGDGLLTLEGVGPGRHVASFEGGEVQIPASHDPALVVSIRLPFHEADEDEREAHARPAAFEAPDHDEAPPDWLVVDPDDEPVAPPAEDPAERIPVEVYDAKHGDLRPE